MIESIINIYGGIILILLATNNIFNQVIIDGYSLDFIPVIFRIILIIAAIGTFIGTIVKFIQALISGEEKV